MATLILHHIRFDFGMDGTSVIDCFHCVGRFDGHSVDDGLGYMLEALSGPVRSCVKGIRCHHGSSALELIRHRAH